MRILSRFRVIIGNAILWFADAAEYERHQEAYDRLEITSKLYKDSFESKKNG